VSVSNKLTSSAGFSISEVRDPQKLYDVFKQSYTAETGKSWDQQKFESRASNWRFYGDENGYVAVRPQRSGMYKLVGVAGAPRSIVRGLDQLIAEDVPIWGAVSEPLALMARRKGFVAPHLHFGGPTLIKHVLSNVPDSVFGGIKPTINNDGSIELDYPDTGKATKYLIANKKYLKQLTGVPQVADKIKESSAVKAFMRLVGL
jgi:hypothetical protein